MYFFALLVKAYIWYVIHMKYSSILIRVYSINYPVLQQIHHCVDHVGCIYMS